jgi:predicted nucleotidyltransferase
MDEVNRIIIFGSRACGDYEEYSDVDLAIDAEVMSSESWIKLRELAYYEVRTVLQISIVNYFKNPDRLKARILEDGKIIYEQQ